MRRRRLWLGIFGALVLASAAFVITRRLSRPPAGPSTQEATPSPVPAIARLAHTGRPVIFVGLDGADWELLDRYLAAGSMPNLARLVREGTGGVLKSLHPPLSPLVWTTMMTGVSPLEHGILDFTRWNAVSGRKEPITSDERKAPAVWNMATYGGKRVASLGLWATFPAEAVNGLMVSDRLFSFLHKEEAPPPGAVYPSGREAWARGALTRVEREVDFAELKAYLPWLEEAEFRSPSETQDPYGHPVRALRRILIETRVYHDLAKEWIRRERPDLTIVYIQGTDSIGHVFAPYAPPRQPAISEEEYRRYSRVPELYFRYVDRLIGEYRELAMASGAVLMLASDHGFLWGEGRPMKVSSFAHATAAKWHRKEGLYVLWGPGIPSTPGHTHVGSVDQVCATMLAILGLPRSRGGLPLPGVERGAQPSVDYAMYYTLPSPARAETSRAAADEDALEKLRALGYIGGGEGKSERGPRSGSPRTAGSYNNEGLILRDQGRTAEAIRAFDKALELDPDLASALWNLSDVLFAEQRDLDRSDQLLVRAFANGLPEGTRYLVGRAIGYQRAGQVERSSRLLSEALKARPDEPEVRLFRGRYRVEQGDCSGALADFKEAARLAPDNPAAYASHGVACLCLGDRSGARRSFLRSLELDPNQPKVREFLRHL